MSAERREHPRVPYSGRAYITYGGRCRSDEVVELSAGGLKLKSSARMKPGNGVKVFLPLPARVGWRLCMLKGKVVRRDRKTFGDQNIAISITEDENDNRGALHEYLTAQVGSH